MLVLTRKKGESLMIGDEIEITVLSAEGDSVKIGINAPKHIGIHRKEIYLSILEENQKASNSLTDLTVLINALKKEEK